MKKLTSYLLALVLALLMIPAAAAATDNAASSVDQALIAAAEDVIEAYEEHYTILNVQPIVTRTQEGADGSTTVDYMLSITCVLKYSSATQLPHVQALCAAMGIDAAGMSATALIQNLEAGLYEGKISVALDGNEFAMVQGRVARAVPTLLSAKIADFIAELEETAIGETIELAASMRVTLDAAGKVVSTLYGGYESYADDISRCVPESRAAMMANGVEHGNEMTADAVRAVPTTPSAEEACFGAAQQYSVSLL